MTSVTRKFLVRSLLALVVLLVALRVVWLVFEDDWHIHSLRKGDELDRMRASLRLGELQSVRALPDLALALRDPSPDVRLSAAIALGTIEADPVLSVPALASAAGDDDRGVRAMSLIALGSFGPKALPAVPTIAKALADADPGVRSIAARALGLIGSEARGQVRDLVASLRDSEPSVRAASAEALGKIGPDARAAVPALVDALGDNAPVGFPVEVALASDVIGRRFGPRPGRIVQTMMRVMEAVPSPRGPAKDLVVRRFVASALGHLGKDAAAAIPALEKLRQDPVVAIRREADVALARIREGGEPHE